MRFIVFQVKAKESFFGRDECSATNKLLDKINQHGFDATFVSSRRREETLPDELNLWEGDYILCFRSFLSCQRN